ncbi:hypothetical protein HAX54_045196 [Datura stramonium]|uniref:Uncharacterized protein n=1 Tax=Datura stramonium TaxID=4076 RepID=A0ABS8SQI3_DATST|nr:hypothetical protein [Datura stramonium]
MSLPLFLGPPDASPAKVPNHAPIATAVYIGIFRIRLNAKWLTMALICAFARIGNNEIIVLVNNAEKVPQGKCIKKGQILADGAAMVSTSKETCLRLPIGGRGRVIDVRWIQKRGGSSYPHRKLIGFSPQTETRSSRLEE